MPLGAFLRIFFKVYSKAGSKDRKIISHLCYSFLRMGDSGKSLSFEERVLYALFICSTKEQFVLSQLKPELNAEVEKPLAEKINSLPFELNIFPLKDEVSPQIDHEAFEQSHLIQPLVYLRIRKGKKDRVKVKILQAGLSYTEGEDWVALRQGTPVEALFDLNREVVIQDLSSQRILDAIPRDQKFNSAWDCCAASGGKTILTWDRLGPLELTVSDIRESILINLDRRLNEAGIKNFKSFRKDLSKEGIEEKFDFVLCDAPCSGSGTWGRTPENLPFFTREKLEYYSSLQKKIAKNASLSVNANGYFLYVTCSVYKEENENVVEYLKSETKLQLVQQSYIKGYDRRADTMFTALFKAS